MAINKIKDKFYCAENTGSFVMQFGWGMSSKNPLNGGKKFYTRQRKYYYEDKRTKKYGAQRPHQGVIGKYLDKTVPAQIYFI